jgi:hypothetical protein
VAPDRRWTVLALAALLAACGGSKKEAEAEKAAEARLAQLRARTDSIRKARTLDSLATVAYTSCSDSVTTVLKKSGAGRRRLAKLAAGEVAPEVTTACGAPKATSPSALAALGDSAATAARAVPTPAPAASPTGRSAAQQQLAMADSARRAGQAAPEGAPAAATLASTRPDSSPAAPQGEVTEVEVLRETFAYGGGARDPFGSLINTKSAGPELIDLQLVGIYQDMRSSANSVAVLREKQSGKRHKLRTGDQIGRLRVAQIRTKDVVFTVEDFGFERQETLSLRKQEDLTQ